MRWTLTERPSRGPIVALCAILALSAAALAIALGTGSWRSRPGPGLPHTFQSVSGPWASQSALGRWCDVQPRDAQATLIAAMGAPSRATAPGLGRELWLNVTPQPLLSLVEAVVPMQRSDGFAAWRGGGYLMADTYSSSGAILRMYAWPVEVGAVNRLGCQPRRGSPFPRIAVPNLLGRTVASAEAMLHAANLTTAITTPEPISNVWLRTAVVRVQSPVAGTSVVAGTPVRLDPLFRGVMSFVNGGLTLQPTGGITNLGVSRDEAIAAYRQHSPGPDGAPTAVLLGYMTSHVAEHPQLHHRLVWVVEYTHARIPRYGPRGGTAIGTWIGVVDARTGQYLTTQNFGF